MHRAPPQLLLREMFDAAVAAAQPALCLPPQLPRPQELGGGRLIVVGAGKAAAAMAQAVEAHWQEADGPLSGLVVTRYGHGAPCERIEVIEAAHPLPDAAGLAAAQRLLEQVQGLRHEDLVLCLLSGGGSALLPAPLGALSLIEKQHIHAALLRSGASIGEMNCVRRHLSALKGGRLAAACHPARVLTLAISDVPGDRLLDIASGPTVADPSTCADALAIVQRYRIELPSAARQLLESGEGESIKPGDPRLARSEYRLIATPQQALEAAARVGRQAGLGGAHPGRRAGGRGARAGPRAGRHGAAGGAARPALRAALRAAVGRRIDGDGTWPRQGRAQRRVPAGAGPGSARPVGHARQRQAQTRNTSMVSSQGQVATVSSVMPILVMPEATYRFRPTGGWHMPTSMFTTMMMPKCTGSMPSFMAMGNRMGARISTMD
jgi:hypothetical protein